MQILNLIKAKQAKVVVVGLGYVGLPLAVEIAKSGYHVTGIDVNEKLVEHINKGKNHIKDVSDKDLKEVISNGSLQVTTDFSKCRDANIISICVPTPLDSMMEPDISYIVSVANSIRPHINGQLISLESTTYPCTTDEDLNGILSQDGAEIDKDFYLAFSPERVDPGNPHFTTKNTPKVVGGVTKTSTEIAAEFYRNVVDTVVPVSHSRVAEMTKLLENIFRCVNIALVNELMLLSDKMDINIWEVIDAASTKPFGFMPFYPGPGLGGHCIPIDPFYLSWKAKQYGFRTHFIELAGETNNYMPDYVVYKVGDALNEREKSIKNSTILVLGMAYKKNVEDLRESPSLAVTEKLLEKGATITYHDPYVESVTISGQKLDSVPLDEKILTEAECVVIVTDHTNVDYEKVVKSAAIIVDSRNVLKNIESEKIVRL